MSDLVFGRRTLRVGITGLARAGKTAFLTSVAANLLAESAGLGALPSLARLRARGLKVAIAPAGASDVPRFDYAAHLGTLARDPPRWPDRTDAVSLLALDVDVARTGIMGALPPQQLRLELLDYPGEWLLDLPMVAQTFSSWSAETLRRLEKPDAAEASRDFLAFARAIPAGAAADEALARTGHDLYRACLRRLRDEVGLSFLQPGRFLMPPPGGEPPWTVFFPVEAGGGLAVLLEQRFDAYRASVRDGLVAPLFGQVDRLVVLADLLTALHAGAAAYADTASALGTVSGALARDEAWVDFAAVLRAVSLPDWLLPRVLGGGGIRRIAYAATKADHVAERQRGNLAALMGALTVSQEAGRVPVRAFAIASVRCTEDFVWTLEGRPVSAVRGRVMGEDRLTRSYPGEVPDTPPDDTFFAHPFLALPAFEPRRLPADGKAGTSQIGLDALLAFLLEDVF